MKFHECDRCNKQYPGDPLSYLLSMRSQVIGRVHSQEQRIDLCQKCDAEIGKSSVLLIHLAEIYVKMKAADRERNK